MKETNEELEVKTADTTISYRKIAPDLFHSHVSYHQELGGRSGSVSREVTITGATWSLVFGGKVEGKAKVVRGQDKLSIKPFFFLPPFSIIEIGFENLACEYQGLVSNLRCLADWPVEPIMFNSDGPQKPVSFEDVNTLLKRRSNEVCISRASEPDPVALKVREVIHQTYEGPCSISDIALDLDIDHSVLTKSFTKAFGIPPVKYRNILRVHDSVRHLLFGNKTATAAAFDVGFEDLSRFNKNFKQIMEAVPSQFVFRANSV
jgi:AraC-like DNA-binding protein